MATNGKPEIHEAMAAILDEIPAIGKDQQNTGLNFRFRGIEPVLNALNPLLGKHGVVPVLAATALLHWEQKTKGYAAVVLATYRFTARDGSFIEAQAAGEGHDFADKAVSKAMTMAQKACLCQTFAIAYEDDPDGDSVQSSTGPSTSSARAESREEAAGARTGAPAASTGDEPKWQKVLAIVKSQKTTDEELANFRAWLEERKIPNDFAKMSDAQLNDILVEVEPF